MPFARVASTVGLLGTLACGVGEAPDRDALRGRVLPESIPRLEFVLDDTNGEAFEFRRQTEGQLTLLFFGYTHCPDVCPVHMANIAAALDEIGWEARRRVQVVFVSTDPERDTPKRIREWLDRFDRDFIGLRGTLEEVNAIQAALGLPPSVVPDEASDAYEVGHAAQVLAFGPDGPATMAYPFGTRRSDWIHDLPRLLEAP